MPESTVEELLAGSAPRYEPSMATRAALDAVISEARVSARRSRSPRHRRLLWLVPGAIAAVGALTAGAVIADGLLHADLPVAVDYTTDTGVTVSCTASISGGSLFSPHRDAVIDYYQTHDFAGVGQQIYDYALVLTGDRPAEPGVLPTSSEWVPVDGQHLSDAEAFTFAETSFLLTDTLVELGIGGTGDASMTSDCTGRLR